MQPTACARKGIFFVGVALHDYSLKSCDGFENLNLWKPWVSSVLMQNSIRSTLCFIHGVHTFIPILATIYNKCRTGSFLKKKKKKMRSQTILEGTTPMKVSSEEWLIAKRGSWCQLAACLKVQFSLKSKIHILQTPVRKVHNTGPSCCEVVVLTMVPACWFIYFPSASSGSAYPLND